MLPYLTPLTPFPSLIHALQSPNGLLAAGADLSPARLVTAYRAGIFPWFNAGEPILWWSPDPRMVLIPSQFQVSHSLQKVLRQHEFEVRFDTQFAQVMRACAAPRKGLAGTWIHEDMVAAYRELHQQCYAHSVEVWQGDNLIGGLYGMAIGRMFYGESMFSAQPNGSKIALAYLCKQLARWQFTLIDCQMYTAHLASLGAHEIQRDEFIRQLAELVNCAPVSNWQFDADLLP
ncbi:MAG: leucyl/phenylalanyl-tRNA--protein transferase [Pseudomonadota bacterium]